MPSNEELEAIAAQANAPVPKVQAPQAGLDALAAVGQPAASQPPVGQPPAPSAPDISPGGQVPPLPAPPVGPSAPAPAPTPAAAPAKIPLITGKPTMAGAAKAFDQAAQAGFDQATAAQAAGAAKAQALTSDADDQSKVAAEQKRQAGEIDAHQKAWETSVEKAHAEAAKAEADFRNTPFRDFWGDKSTPEKMLAGLFIGLGQAGSALSGVAGNPALERVKALEQASFEKQRMALGTKEAFAKMKADGVTSLEAGYKQSLAALQLKQAAALDSLATEAKAQAMRNGATAQEAETNAVVQGYRKEALETRARGYEGIAHAQGQLAIAGATLAETRREHDLVSQDRRDIAAERGAERRNKAADADDARTVQLDDGSNLVLPSPRAVPQFTAGYNSRVQAQQKIKALRDDIAENRSVYLPDAVARRQALIHDANIAVGAISSMGASDHSAHLELGTLGPGGVRTMPWEGSPDVALQLLDEKSKQISDGTDRIISTMRRDRTAAPASAGGTTPSAPATAPRAPTFDRQSLAREALKPGSGASPEEIAQAKKILKGG